ncbi:hypothetical protein KI688_002190 [Linnemannia hyalina]|uniref:Uncharacterized protein n=1 Tax=Linnemannia hyalina TaxID=64524 RepID=A0A9P7XTF2_9FUNG|nr:hypothetical protein KI688_002190 [Linnemannia hyalina]
MLAGQLSLLQKFIVDILVTLPGQYLVTGAAGSGKSNILMALVDKLRSEADRDRSVDHADQIELTPVAKRKWDFVNSDVENIIKIGD